MSCHSALLLAVLCATAAPGVVSTAAAQARSTDATKWEVPRTPDGHPDLQGNWTNVPLEYDNVQGGANHVHSVWRDPENDFGDDLLRGHYEEAEHN